jgi:glutaredoxin
MDGRHETLSSIRRSLATMTGKAFLKQQCPLAFVVLAWAMYIGGTVALVVMRQWMILGTWILVAPVAMWAYVKWFPAISPLMGYGRVDDVPAVPLPSTAMVTVYTALGCPFCPIVTHRVRELEASMGFTLREVDVTARPDILTRKGIWSVPVVEVGDRRIVGHATSQELVAFIASPDGEGAPARPPRLASLTPQKAAAPVRVSR